MTKKKPRKKKQHISSGGKKKKVGRKAKISWIQILAAIVIIAAIILLSIRPGGLNDADKKVVGSTEIPFTKEGSLTFFDSDSDQEIQTIDIEIADNTPKRTRGLMYRYSMKEKQGMLFIMDREEPQAFWMRNTYISLDIIYVDASYRIVSISKYTPTLSDQSLPSIKPAKYVVEVVAGFCDKNSVAEGDYITFERQPSLP
jgi:uncharacterized membrane protein (UPF0127 family)